MTVTDRQSTLPRTYTGSFRPSLVQRSELRHSTAGPVQRGETSGYSAAPRAPQDAVAVNQFVRHVPQHLTQRGTSHFCRTVRSRIGAPNCREIAAEVTNCSCYYWNLIKTATLRFLGGTLPELVQASIRVHHIGPLAEDTQVLTTVYITNMLVCLPLPLLIRCEMPCNIGPILDIHFGDDFPVVVARVPCVIFRTRIQPIAAVRISGIQTIRVGVSHSLTTAAGGVDLADRDQSNSE